MKPILIIKNNVHEGPGIIEEILIKRELPYTISDLDNGDVFPTPGQFSAVIVLGGPDSANDNGEKMTMEIQRVKEVIELGIPYLGICLGMQVLCKAAGGRIVKSLHKEISFFHDNHDPYTIKKTCDDEIFTGLPDPFRVFQLHTETVELPECAEMIGIGNFIGPQVIKVGRNAYGFQCHFELTGDIIEECLEFDEDLKLRDPIKLRSQWNLFRDEYFRKGKIITENFLKIAGIL